MHQSIQAKSKTRRRMGSVSAVFCTLFSFLACVQDSFSMEASGKSLAPVQNADTITLIMAAVSIMVLVMAVVVLMRAVSTLTKISEE